MVARRGRGRGRRGLEVLDALKREDGVELEVLDLDVPGVHEVDAKLVRICLDRGAALLTLDTNLAKAAALAGVQVMLPVLTGEPDWAWYTGPAALAPGARGIPRPEGAALGPEALRAADWIWLPGLAGTTQGHRLGTGGGWYDRALAWAGPTAQLGLLLFDDEVLDAVPTDPWDRDVHVLVTERRRVDCTE